MIGHISLLMKLAGKLSTGNLYAEFDEADTGNGLKKNGYRASIRPYLWAVGDKQCFVSSDSIREGGRDYKGLPLSHFVSSDPI